MNPVQPLTLEIATLSALQHLAEALALWLQPGDIVTLDGPLGAGKTTTVQAIAQALGINEPVTSPTFALMQRYDMGRLPLVHVDLYRLGPLGETTAGEALAQELDELMADGHAVLVVEWARYAPWLAAEATLRLSYTSGGDESERRQLTLSANRPLPDVLTTRFNRAH
jgi:tRNA threonylcarbamoyladenosine biosynthesis protein TsaE